MLLCLSTDLVIRLFEAAISQAALRGKGNMQVASLRASFPNEVEARYMSFLTNVEEAGDGAAPEVPKITFLHKLVPGQYGLITFTPHILSKQKIKSCSGRIPIKDSWFPCLIHSVITNATSQSESVLIRQRPRGVSKIEPLRTLQGGLFWLLFTSAFFQQQLPRQGPTCKQKKPHLDNI